MKLEQVESFQIARYYKWYIQPEYGDEQTDAGRDG